MKTYVSQRKGFQVRTLGIPLDQLKETMVMILEVAMEQAIIHWRQNFGPEHFRMGAYARYGGREDGVYPYRYTSRKPRAIRAPLRSERPHKDYDGTWVQPGGLQRAFLQGEMRLETKGSSAADLSVTATFPELPRYTYITKTAVYRRVHAGLFSKAQTVKTWVPLPKKWLELTITTEAEAQALVAFVAKRADELTASAQNGQTPQPQAA